MGWNKGLWRRGFVADACCVALLWLLLILFFWRIVTPDAGSRMVIVSGDFTSQFYPFQAFVASELHSGRIPVWNPYVFGGHPAAGDPLTSLSYPVGLLIDYVLGADGFTLLDMEWRAIVHYGLAALFTYVFARDLVGSRLGGTIASTAFTFSGFMLSYPNQATPILETAAWLPLIAWFILRAKRDENRWAAELCFAGAALGIAFLVGHPQTAMYIAYASLLYLLYSAWEARWPWRRVLLGGMCLGGVSLGTAAAQLLPSMEFFPLSNRVSLSYAAISHGYELSSPLGIILPNWRNEKALSVGIVPLVMALFAIQQRVKGGSFWVFLAAGSLLLSLGGKVPTFRVLVRVVPGLGMVQDQERVAVLLAFSLSILAAYGVVRLAVGSGGSLRAQAVRLLPPFVCLGLASFLPFVTTEWPKSTAFRPGLYAGLLSGYELFLVLAVASFVVIWLFASRPDRLPSGFYAVLLVGFVVGDSFLFNWDNNIVKPPEVSQSDSAAATIAFLRSQPGVFRVRLENDNVLPSNYLPLAELATFHGNTPIRVSRIDDLIRSKEEWKNWQLFNVEYVVAKKDMGEGVKLIFEDGDLKTFRMLYGLPRAYAVMSYIVASDPAESLALTLDLKRHPGDQVILEEAPSFDGSPMATERPEVEIVDYSPQRIIIQANGTGNAMLVVSEAYYPGWKAYLDGAPTRIYAANHAFRGVELPSGKHTVEMRYEPLAFTVGAATTAVFLMGVLCVGIVASVRRAGASLR